MQIKELNVYKVLINAKERDLIFFFFMHLPRAYCSLSGSEENDWSQVTSKNRRCWGGLRHTLSSPLLSSPLLSSPLPSSLPGIEWSSENTFFAPSL